MRQHKWLLAIVSLAVGVSFWGCGSETELNCIMCSNTVKAQTVHLLKLTDGETRLTCCSCCGLVLQKMLTCGMIAQKEGKSKVRWSYVTDYDTGEFVKAEKAYYVRDSNVTPCCTPNIIAFATRKKAGAFCDKAGGKILAFGPIMAQACPHTMMKGE